MSEPIVYHPYKITQPDGAHGGTAVNHGAASRPFSDILAEAESVRDAVELKRGARPKSWAAVASGTVQSTIAMLARPLPALGGPFMRERFRRQQHAVEIAASEE